MEINVHNYKNVKKIKLHDRVVFLENHTYEVCDSYLHHVEGINDAIFSDLGLNKMDFCKEHYGYSVSTGCWPDYKYSDYEAAKRVIDALFDLIIEKGHAKPTTKKDTKREQIIESKEVQITVKKKKSFKPKIIL